MERILSSGTIKEKKTMMNPIFVKQHRVVKKEQFQTAKLEIRFFYYCSCWMYRRDCSSKRQKKMKMKTMLTFSTLHQSNVAGMFDDDDDDWKQKMNSYS